jgi:ABC-2 type transport system permease protein
MTRFLRRTWAMAHKEILHMSRDVRVVFLAIGMPVLLLVLFGYGVSTDVDRVPLAVIDQDGTKASRRLIEGMVAGGAFVRAVDLQNPEDAAPLFRRGVIKAALVLPKGYQRDLARGGRTGAQMLVDGTDAGSAPIALGDALGVAQSIQPAGASAKATLAEGPRVRVRYNPAMRSAYNIVPGIIAMVMAMVAALLAALTVAREWERGNMEQLFATPVGRTEIILGKLVPYTALGMLQTLLVVTVGSWLFDVPLRGSLGLLFGASLLFLLGMLGIGIWVSVRTKAQLLAVQFALMASYLPAMMLSGFMFPIANMPWPLRMLSTVVPARFYINLLRGTMLKGNTADVFTSAILALCVFAAAMITLTVRSFQRRLV